MKVKLYPPSKRPSYMHCNGIGNSAFLIIWAYCVEYSYCKHPKETLRKLYLTEKECSSDYWDKFVKANFIKGWCYYEELIFVV